MPHEKIHHPARYLAPGLAVALLVVVLGLLAVTSNSSPRRGSVDGAGTIEVDGRVLAFDAETCVITDGSFVASGPGTWGGDHFVASVSSSGLEVAFGVTSDVDEPDPDTSWWVANGLHTAQIDGDMVRATAQAQDRTGQVEGPRTAVVQITCTG